MTRALLVCLAWLSAVAAIIGGLFEFGTTWVAAWGLVMALALIAWGLLKALADDRGQPDAEYDLDAWPGVLLHRADGRTDDDDELPFRGPVRTETVYRAPIAWQHIEGGKRAMWPNEIGAPE